MRKFCLLSHREYFVVWVHYRVQVIIFLIPRWVRGHSRWSLLFPGTYSHSVNVVLNVTFIPDWLWTKWYWINGWQTIICFLILTYKCNVGDKYNFLTSSSPRVQDPRSRNEWATWRRRKTETRAMYPQKTSNYSAPM